MVGDEKEGRRTSKSWATDRGDRQKECRRTSKSWAADRGEGDKRNAEAVRRERKGCIRQAGAKGSLRSGEGRMREQSISQSKFCTRVGAGPPEEGEPADAHESPATLTLRVLKRHRAGEWEGELGVDFTSFFWPRLYRILLIILMF
jgi:hypothetical protein